MADYPEDNYWVTDDKLVLETLPDIYVLEFIVKFEKARADFDIIFPYLSEERQEYLTELIEAHPFVKTKKYIDPKTVSDHRQRKVNTAGIRLPMTPRLKKLKRQQEAKKNEEG